MSLDEAAHKLLIVANSLAVGLQHVSDRLRSGEMSVDDAAATFAAWLRCIARARLS